MFVRISVLFSPARTIAFWSLLVAIGHGHGRMFTNFVVNMISCFVICVSAGEIRGVHDASG